MKDLHNCKDFMEEGESGMCLQGKQKITKTHETLRRHFCFISIVVLLVLMVAIVVTFAVKKERPVLVVHVHSACPSKWIGFESKCFYFSEDTGNWTFSQSFCNLLEANLVQIDTTDELNFLERYKGPDDHWIGLSRESSSHSWKWTNNTGGDFVFKVRGTGECAYLNNNGVSSGRSYIDRKWICSKPNSHTYSDQINSNSGVEKMHCQ